MPRFKLLSLPHTQARYKPLAQAVGRLRLITVLAPGISSDHQDRVVYFWSAKDRARLSEMIPDQTLGNP